MTDGGTRHELPPEGLLDDAPDQDEHFQRIRDFVAERGPEQVAKVVALWIGSPDDRVRAVALDCLAVLPPATPGMSECFDRAVGLLLGAPDRDVRWALAHALLLQPGVNRTDALVMLARDTDRDVRWLVAQALLPHNESADGVATLLHLSEDLDGGVRDWALHGLASLSNPTEEVLQKLRSHVDDPHPEAAAEAVLGLARAHDAVAVPVLVERLSDRNVGEMYIEAAEECGDPRLQDPLLALWKSDWAEDEQAALLLQLALRSSGYGGAL